MPNRTVKRKATGAVVASVPVTEPAGTNSARYVPNFSKRRKTFRRPNDKTAGNDLQKIPITESNDPHNSITDATLPSFPELNFEHTRNDQQNILQQRNVKNSKNDLLNQATNIKFSENTLCKNIESVDEVTDPSPKGNVNKKVTKTSKRASKKRKLRGPKELTEVNPINMFEENASSCSIHTSGCLNQVMLSEKDGFQGEKDNNVVPESFSMVGEGISALEKRRYSASSIHKKESSDQNDGRIQINVTTAQLLDTFRFVPKEEQTTVTVEIDNNTNKKAVSTDPNNTDTKQTLEDTSYVHNRSEQLSPGEVVKDGFCAAGEMDGNQKEKHRKKIKKKNTDEMSIVANIYYSTSTCKALEECTDKESECLYTSILTSENEPVYANISSMNFEDCAKTTANDIQVTAGAETYTANEGLTQGPADFRKINENLQVKIKDNLDINTKKYENLTEITQVTKDESHFQIACDRNESNVFGGNHGASEPLNLAEDAKKTELVDASSDIDIINTSETCVLQVYTIPPVEKRSPRKSETVDNILNSNISSSEHEEACNKTCEYDGDGLGEQQKRTTVIELSKVNESHIEDDSLSYGISNDQSVEQSKLGVSEVGNVDFSDPHEKHDNYDWYSNPGRSQSDYSPRKRDSKIYNITDDKISTIGSETHNPVAKSCQGTGAWLDGTEDLPGNVRSMSSDVMDGAVSCFDKEETVLTSPCKTDCLSHCTENESNNLRSQQPITPAAEETEIGGQVPSVSSFSKPESQTICPGENNVRNGLCNDNDKQIMSEIVCGLEVKSSGLLKEAEEKLFYVEYTDKKTNSSYTHSPEMNGCSCEDGIQNPKEKAENAELPNIFENESLRLLQQAFKQEQNNSSQTNFDTNEISKVCVLQDDLEGIERAAEVTSRLKTCISNENDYDFSLQEITVLNLLQSVRKSEVCPDNFMKEQEIILDDTEVNYGRDDPPLLTEANCASDESADTLEKLEKSQLMSASKNKTNTYSDLRDVKNKNVHNSFAHSANLTEMPKDQVCESMVFMSLEEEEIGRDQQEKKSPTQKWSEDLKFSKNDGDMSHIGHPLLLALQKTGTNPTPIFLEDNCNLKEVGIHGDLEINENTCQISSKTDNRNLLEMGTDDIFHVDETFYSEQRTQTDVYPMGIDKRQSPCTVTVTNASSLDSSFLPFKNSDTSHIKSTAPCCGREDIVVEHSACNVQYVSSDSTDWHTFRCGTIYRSNGGNSSPAEKLEESESNDDDEELFCDSTLSNQTYTKVSVTVKHADEMNKDCDNVKSKIKTEGNEKENKASSSTIGDNYNINISRCESEGRHPESCSSIAHCKDSIDGEGKFTTDANGTVEKPVVLILKEDTESVLSSSSVTVECRANNEEEDRGWEEDILFIPDFHDIALKPDTGSAYEQFEEEFDDDFELTASQLSRMDADVLKETTAHSGSVTNNAEVDETTSYPSEMFENNITLEILNRLRSIDNKITNLQEEFKILQVEVANIRKR